MQADDYYPFGLTFNSYSRENSVPNMYQYNGKEEQDELSLGWLDYGARMYMAEIGRWNRPDRFALVYSSFSPYHYAGNNPVYFFDINGDYFTGATDKVKSIEEEATRRLEKSKDNITALMSVIQTAMTTGNADVAELAAESLRGNIKERDGFQATLTEIAELRESDQEYHVSMGGVGNSAETSWDRDKNAVVISISATTGNALLAHELKHAYQFEAGTNSFGALPGNKGRSYFLADISDEVAGYERQALFDYSSLPDGLANGINSKNVRPLIFSDGSAPYTSLPENQQHNVPVMDSPRDQQAVNKGLAKGHGHAFRNSGVTYYPGMN